MPFYEYECADCEEVTEALRRMVDADNAPECEHCGSKKTTRKVSIFNASSDSGSMPEMPSGGGCCGGGCGCSH
ncbi:zinc ribbon domain-containing protein [Planctomycetota bacterium]|nr:zinc ribbon domain-containing protein [Planctomycetota bacterium]